MTSAPFIISQSSPSGTAFIFADVFDEYAYHPETLTAPPSIRPRDKIKHKKRKPKQRARQSQPETSETESDSGEDENDKSYAPDEEDDDEAEKDDYMPENSAFEVPLDTLIECLNIFGTAGSLAGAFSESNNAGRGKARARVRGGRQGGMRGNNDDSDPQENDAEEGNARGLDAFFGGKAEKKTSMRLSYPGSGYPLTLIVSVSAFHLISFGAI